MDLVGTTVAEGHKMFFSLDQSFAAIVELESR